MKDFPSAVLAIVTDAPFVETDGVFVTVKVLPELIPTTARVGAAFSGVGRGLHLPLEVNDEVVCVVPMDSPDEGLVIVGRMWSASDPVPQLAVDFPHDVTLHCADGQSLRIKVIGNGTVTIQGESTIEVDAPVVKVAGDTDYMVRGNLLKSALTTLGTTISSVCKTVATPLQCPAAIQAIGTAFDAFMNSIGSMLSTKAKLG